MNQLCFLGPHRVEWREAPDPQLLCPSDALVRPVAVATCDLDTALLRGDAPFEGPFPLGHEGVAEVLQVGEEVSTVAIGDLVIVPFQISCGSCDRCVADLTASCRTEAVGAMYGLEPFGGPWGGFLSDVVRVPWADAMLIRLPPDLDPLVVASMSDNIPDAWRTIGPHLHDPSNTSVLVVGGAGPSLPFYAIGIARALGARSVAYADHDVDRLSKAERLGAEPIEGYGGRSPGSFGVTVCTAGSRDALIYALRSTEPDGTCTCNTIFFANEVALPMLEMYTRGVTLVTGRVNARATIPRVLDLMTNGLFDPSSVTDSVVDWDDACAALVEGPRKLVMHRPTTLSLRTS